MNKRVLESLIKAGALDSFGQRAQLMAAVDKAMERAQKSQRDLAAGQNGLFGGLGGDLRRCAGEWRTMRRRPAAQRARLG